MKTPLRLSLGYLERIKTLYLPIAAPLSQIVDAVGYFFIANNTRKHSHEGVLGLHILAVGLRVPDSDASQTLTLMDR